MPRAGIQAHPERMPACRMPSFIPPINAAGKAEARRLDVACEEVPRDIYLKVCPDATMLPLALPSTTLFNRNDNERQQHI